MSYLHINVKRAKLATLIILEMLGFVFVTIIFIICYTPLVDKKFIMKLNSKITADFVFTIHLILVCIVALGWLIPGFFYVHITLLLATFLSEIFLGYCPLTTLEFGIRKKLDPSLLFDKSCIIHYLRKWRGLEPRVSTTKNISFLKRNSSLFILFMLGILVFSLNLFIRINQIL